MRNPALRMRLLMLLPATRSLFHHGSVMRLLTLCGLVAASHPHLNDVATHQPQGQCVTAAHTDLSRPGQGPEQDDCPSAAACCALCTGKAPFFVFQELGACYCKEPPFVRNPAPHTTAGSCSDLPLPPCTSVACRLAARLPGPAQLRFSVDGGGLSASAVVCTASGRGARHVSGTVSPIDILRAQMREPRPPVSTTLHTPTGSEENTLARVTDLLTPVAINNSCMRVDGGSTTVDGPGILFTSRNNGTTWDNGTTSRRRDCHSAAPPSTFRGAPIQMERGCQQNDSLADG